MRRIEELAQSIRDELAGLVEEAEKRQRSIDELGVKQNVAQEATAAAQANMEVSRQRLAKAEVTTKDALKDLSESIQRTQADVTGLTRRKAQLLVDNARLERENHEFLKYKDRAWAELNAMDDALKGRESVVEQKEQFKPRSKSFLPPLDE